MDDNKAEPRSQCIETAVKGEDDLERKERSTLLKQDVRDQIPKTERCRRGISGLFIPPSTSQASNGMGMSPCFSESSYDWTRLQLTKTSISLVSFRSTPPRHQIHVWRTEASQPAFALWGGGERARAERVEGTGRHGTRGEENTETREGCASVQHKTGVVKMRGRGWAGNSVRSAAPEALDLDGWKIRGADNDKAVPESASCVGDPSGVHVTRRSRQISSQALFPWQHGAERGEEQASCRRAHGHRCRVEPRIK